MAELCLRVLDGLRITAELALSIVVPMFMGKMISGTVTAIEL